jgi:hypothetical protein
MMKVTGASTTTQVHLKITKYVTEERKQLPSLVTIAFPLPCMFDAAWYTEFFYTHAVGSDYNSNSL